MDAGETRKSAFPRETEIRDGLFEDEAPVVRLSRFEGPLDLLLFLIRKNEIDVCDIPVESVTRQYLEILHGNERLDLDVAGDFFVMAATLMHIKSRMLLPTSENVPEKNDAGTDGEEDPDPRWELVRQLIQYKRLKESSRRIAELAAARQRYAERAIVPEDAPEERPVAPVGRMDLWNVFNLVLKRLADRILPGEIQGDAVTIAQRMEDILARASASKNLSRSRRCFRKNSRSPCSFPRSWRASNSPASGKSSCGRTKFSPKSTARRAKRATTCSRRGDAPKRTTRSRSSRKKPEPPRSRRLRERFSGKNRLGVSRG